MGRVSVALKRLVLAILACLALSPVASADVLLNGSGSTFAFPLYSKWIDAFHQREPSIPVNYQSIGSGAGVANIIAGTTDFGASDGPLSDQQLQGLSVPILHFPTALGAVVVTFNVNHIDRLRFDPDTIAGIFLGKITNWQDPAIRRNTSMPPRCADHRRPSRGRKRHKLRLYRLPLQGES
jgi:phosphate transport system substrate-binding protein